MIKGFKDPNAQAVFKGKSAGKGFPSNLIRVARRKLIMLNGAQTLDDLQNPPANYLEALEETGKDNIRSGSTISFGFALFGPA